MLKRAASAHRGERRTVPPMKSAETAHAEIAAMSYEQARDELVGIVARLEGGQADLEESMQLWERGEQLAEHCTRWLDGAQARLIAHESRGEESPRNPSATPDDSESSTAEDPS